jgi:hypothetical protein
MTQEPAQLNRTRQRGTKLARRGTGIGEGLVHQHDVDAPNLHRLDRVGDLHQLAGCDIIVGKRTSGDEL